MTRLQDLSEDVLALIFVGECSVEALALWMTLNRQMQAKLANGGLNHLEITHINIANGVSWPQYINRLKLRSLRILRLQCRTELPLGPQLRSELRQLWHGLETLEIGGQDVEKAFELEKHVSKRKKPKKVTYSRKGPSKRAKLADNADPSAEEALSGDWNMNITHPSLKSLTIASGGAFRNGRFPKLDFGNVAFLPRSLTHLDVSQTGFLLTVEGCLNLPPQLTTLILPRTSLQVEDPPPINDDIIDCLPHSLTRIEPCSDAGACYSLEAMVKLANPHRKCLPNLASFPDCGNLEYWYYLYKQHGAWPSNVFEMDLTTNTNVEFPEDWIHSYSPQWPSGWPYTSFLEQLPFTLTSLTAKKLPWTQLAAAPDRFWSSTLTSLSLRQKEIDHHFFHLLPRNLKRFKLWLWDHRGTTDASVALLLQRGRDILQDIDAKKWSQAKLQLIAHRDSELDADRKAEIDKYISEVELGALYGLPLSLESLEYSTYIGSCPASLLPPFVTRSKLQCYTMPDPSISPIRAISPFLTDLDLSVQQDDSLKTLASTSSGAHALRHSQIISFSLRIDSLRAPYLLDFLPRDLRELSLHSERPLSLATFEKLPQSLRHLQLFYSSSFGYRPSEEPWVKALPRNLLVLDVNGSIEGSQYAVLPPTLEVLCAYPPQGHLDQIAARPASLWRGCHYHSRHNPTHTHLPPSQLQSWSHLRAEIQKSYIEGKRIEALRK